VTTLLGIGPLLCKAVVGIGQFFGYRKRCDWLVVKPNGPDLEFVAQLVNKGVLRPVVESTYSLNEIRNAHEESEKRHTRGKIVIKIA